MPTEADYRLADEWLAPYLDIRAMPSRGIARERLAEKLAQARAEALEEAARLHEQVYVGHHQDPMAAVIEYRDLILALKDKHE